mmetsp:Transcript_30790/g.70622  ORF Transcript_30790/g.70622 Transcript_30790/m.70622 type:complete len:217 (+) Transcript_30790:59-709(+)
MPSILHKLRSAACSFSWSDFPAAGSDASVKWHEREVCKHRLSRATSRFVAASTATRPTSPVKSLKAPIYSVAVMRPSAISCLAGTRKAMSSAAANHALNISASASSSMQFENAPERNTGSSCTFASQTSFKDFLAVSIKASAFFTSSLCVAYIACFAAFCTSRQPLITASRFASKAAYLSRSAAHSSLLSSVPRLEPIVASCCKSCWALPPASDNW